MTLKGHDSGVWSAAYSPNGKRIATAGSDGIVQIYTTDMDELLQIAESRVTRQLTAEEKEKYGVLDLTGSAARCVAGSAHGSNAS